MEYFHLMSYLSWIFRKCYQHRGYLTTYITFTSIIGGYNTLLSIPTHPCSEFLLLIDVPIQDQSQQLSMYEFFTLDIPHGNCTTCYDITPQCFGTTQDETMVVEISPHQFSICQEANGQFCNILTPFQLIANLPTCTTALYTKNTASISAQCLLKIRKTHNVYLHKLHLMYGY